MYNTISINEMAVRIKEYSNMLIPTILGGGVWRVV